MQAQAANAMVQAKGAAQSVGDMFTDFFHGNPFATPVGLKIEQATDSSLASENWDLNMEICDHINNTIDGAHDAIRAMKKRLQTQIGKNNITVMYTLTVLETCVKNCHQCFRILACQKEFIQELVKLIGPKFDPPQIVQERVLSLIQSWADAFRNNPELHNVCEVYNDLKQKGVEFPMTDLDTMAPIVTPNKTVFSTKPKSSQLMHANDYHLNPSREINRPNETPNEIPVEITDDQLAKLRRELDIVNGNLRVFREMLSELAPGVESDEDFQLLQELRKTCHEMQIRIMHLLQSFTNEQVISELLLINDEMNNVFIKYERYMTNRNTSNNEIDADRSLIDFEERATDLDVNESAQKSKQTDGFDMFAQARSTTFEQSRQSGSTYMDNSSGLDQTETGLSTVVQEKTSLKEPKTEYKSSDSAQNSEHRSSAEKDEMFHL